MFTLILLFRFLHIHMYLAIWLKVNSISFYHRYFSSLWHSKSHALTHIVNSMHSLKSVCVFLCAHSMQFLPPSPPIIFLCFPFPYVPVVCLQCIYIHIHTYIFVFCVLLYMNTMRKKLARATFSLSSLPYSLKAIFIQMQWY